MKKKIIIGIVLVLIIAVGAGVYFLSMGSARDADDASALSITVEQGMGASQIADLLEQNGIIDSASEFQLWSKVKGYDSQFKAGTYSLSPAMDFEEIADILVGGKVSMVSFTVPEGLTVEQTIDKLVEQGMGDKEAFEQEVISQKWLERFEFIDELAFDRYALNQTNSAYLEGYLMPNTYYVEQGASEEDVIATMLTQFEKDVYQGVYADFLAESSTTLMTKYGDYLFGESQPSLYDFLIYSSIIERETVLDEERPKVAAVIYNRLKNNMKLQMCSTVQYILGFKKDNLTYSDISIDSPYNTYIYSEIPGPICSPGLASIKAALYPDDDDYLYFVVSEKLDGSMNFSSDINQFEKDKAAYSAAYNAAN